MKVAGDLAEMIGRCAAELIHILGSQAQEECEKEKKKLLMGEHIVKYVRCKGRFCYLVFAMWVGFFNFVAFRDFSPLAPTQGP